MNRIIICIIFVSMFTASNLLATCCSQTHKEKEVVLVSSFGRTGKGNGAFGKPLGANAIAVFPKGDLVIVDTCNHRVQIFNRKGQFLRKFGKFGHSTGLFSYPVGVATLPTGDIVIADTNNHRIQIFDADGKYLRQFGKEGTGEGEFRSPNAVAVTRGGEIVVVDSYIDRVQIFDADGKYLRQFGNIGIDDGEFEHPSAVAISPAGEILVVDTDNHRVQIFDAGGKYLRQFGKEGTNDGEFGSSVTVSGRQPEEINRYVRGPAGLAVMPSGEIIVADTGNYCLQMFSADGKFLKRFGQQRPGKGLLSHISRGVVCLDANTLAVTDSSSNQIQIYQLKK